MLNFTLTQKSYITILPSLRRELRNMIEGDRAANPPAMSVTCSCYCYPPNQHAQNCQSL